MSKVDTNKHIDFVFKSDEAIDSVLVAEDGNVFVNDNKGKSFCRNHCRDHGIKFNQVSREEFYSKSAGDDKKSEKPLAKMVKAELLKKCEELQIEVDSEAANKVLVKAIEDHLSAAASTGEGSASVGSGADSEGSEGGSEAGAENNESETDNTAE